MFNLRSWPSPVFWDINNPVQSHQTPQNTQNTSNNPHRKKVWVLFFIHFISHFSHPKPYSPTISQGSNAGPVQQNSHSASVCYEGIMNENNDHTTRSNCKSAENNNNNTTNQHSPPSHTTHTIPYSSPHHTSISKPMKSTIVPSNRATNDFFYNFHHNVSKLTTILLLHVPPRYPNFQMLNKCYTTPRYVLQAVGWLTITTQQEQSANQQEMSTRTQQEHNKPTLTSTPYSPC